MRKFGLRRGSTTRSFRSAVWNHRSSRRAPNRLLHQRIEAADKKLAQLRDLKASKRKTASKRTGERNARRARSEEVRARLSALSNRARCGFTTSSPDSPRAIGNCACQRKAVAMRESFEAFPAGFSGSTRCANRERARRPRFARPPAANRSDSARTRTTSGPRRARLAQWESITLTLWGSQVQSLHRAPSRKP